MNKVEYMNSKGKLVKRRFTGPPKTSEVVKAYVKKTINRKFETKYDDEIINGFQLTQTLTLADMTGLAQGAAFNERIGSEIAIKRFITRYALFCGTSSSIVRLINLVWKPDNAVAPLISSILANGPGGAPDILSNYNRNNRANYTILSDRTHQLIAGTSSEYNRRVFHYEDYKNLPSYTSYTPTLNTGEHHIYSFLISDQTAGANAPSIYYSSRIEYKDA